MDATRLDNNSDTFLEKGQVSENLNKKSTYNLLLTFLLEEH